MDDARDESGSGEAIGGQAEEDGQIRSDALELAASTTLVEVTPGVAVVFGEVPDGLELISLDMVPSFDRAQLSTALGSFGNAVSGAYKIIATLPKQDGELQYRIKSEHEPFQRTVKEYLLERA